MALAPWPRMSVGWGFLWLGRDVYIKLMSGEGWTQTPGLQLNALFQEMQLREGSAVIQPGLQSPGFLMGFW